MNHTLTAKVDFKIDDCFGKRNLYKAGQEVRCSVYRDGRNDVKEVIVLDHCAIVPTNYFF